MRIEGQEIKQILEVFGHPLSGMKSLVVEEENGNISMIHGDWRMINNIVEAKEWNIKNY